MNKQNNKEILYSVILLVTPLLVLFSFIFFTKLAEQKSVTKTKPEPIAEVQNYTRDLTGLGIKAKAVYVEKVNTGQVIYAKNENLSLPLASLTKVMTVLVASENYKNDTIVSVNDRALKTEGEYSIRSGERFKLMDLIDLTLVGSVNDAAAAISAIGGNSSEKEFIIKMNSRAKEIGMENTIFKNETGLDQNETEAGSYGSARDMSKLMTYTLGNYPEVFNHTAEKTIRTNSLDGFYYQINNTNEIVKSIPGLAASKTGFTDIAGGNLAVVTDMGLNDPYVIVVLGSTEEGRFEDVNKIISALMN